MDLNEYITYDNIINNKNLTLNSLVYIENKSKIEKKNLNLANEKLLDKRSEWLNDENDDEDNNNNIIEKYKKYLKYQQENKGKVPFNNQKAVFGISDIINLSEEDEEEEDDDDESSLLSQQLPVRPTIPSLVQPKLNENEEKYIENNRDDIWETMNDWLHNCGVTRNLAIMKDIREHQNTLIGDCNNDIIEGEDDDESVDWSLLGEIPLCPNVSHNLVKSVGKNKSSKRDDNNNNNNNIDDTLNNNIVNYLSDKDIFEIMKKVVSLELLHNGFEACSNQPLKVLTDISVQKLSKLCQILSKHLEKFVQLEKRYENLSSDVDLQLLDRDVYDPYKPETRLVTEATMDELLRCVFDNINESMDPDLIEFYENNIIKKRERLVEYKHTLDSSTKVKKKKTKR